jgi:hypothetical protein
MLTNVKEINKVIINYTKGLILWEKYDNVSNYLKKYIKNNYYKYLDMNEDGNLNMDKWLNFKNSYLYKNKIYPADFELNVEMRYRFDKHVNREYYDFEMILLERINKHMEEEEEEDSWGSIDPADWHVF